MERGNLKYARSAEVVRIAAGAATMLLLLVGVIYTRSFEDRNCAFCKREREKGCVLGKLFVEGLVWAVFRGVL